ncbi:MAG: hypothetical protein JXR95_02030 [Deltaproteobacteria bacterium]|nr:hypothetical protein [Deltaproteobacteria bacterium]
MKKLGISLVMLILTVWIGEAQAVSHHTLRHMRNAKGVVRISGLKVIKSYETGPVNRAVVAHYKNLESNLGRAISNYNRIPRRDLGDPEVRKFGNFLRALTAHLNILRTRVKNKSGADKAVKDLHFAFKKRFSTIRYRKAIGILNQINLNPKSTALDYLLRGGGGPKVSRKVKKSNWRTGGAATSDNAAGFNDFRAAIREIQHGCNGKFRGVQNLRTWSHGIDTSFGTWCELVGKSEFLIKQGIKAAVEGILRFPLKALDDAVDSMMNKSGFISTRTGKWILHPKEYKDKLRAQIASYGATAGVKLDDSWVLSSWTSAITKAREILDKSARKHVMKDAGYKHSFSKVERMVKSDVRKNWKKGVDFRKVRMVRSNWLLVKNKLTGLPMRRVKGGALLYKMPREKWCRIRTFEYNEPYKGGGRYVSKGEFSWSEYIRFQNCK